MKKLIISLLICLPLLAFADETWFCEGTKWEMKHTSCVTPAGCESRETVIIKGETEIYGEKALMMYSGDSEKPESEYKFFIYVRTESEKVYFTNDISDGKWWLMYDFSLQPGEGATVYFPTEQHSEPWTAYLKCVERKPATDNSPGIMVMEEYKDETCDFQFFGTTDWYVGIGAEYGVDFNYFADICGMGSRLICAENNGKILYKNATLGTEEISLDKPKVCLNGHVLNISGLQNQKQLDIYGIDGKKAGSTVVVNGNASFTFSAPGVYIIPTDKTNLRIAVK